MTVIKRLYGSAPIRICDIGGWTDTWFAEYGSIFNIAVSPFVDVQITVFERKIREQQVRLIVENYDDDYFVDLSQSTWERHDLLEATIQHLGIPSDYAIDIAIHSNAPAGASVGTSASVTVALIATLDRLTPNQLTAHELAYTAHTIESKILGRQSGIQDQLAAAYGGINYIDMYDYPHASVSRLTLPQSILRELNRRLSLVYLGTSHDSSQVHETVIANLESIGAEAKALKALRTTASQAKQALFSHDFAEFGAVMQRNTEMQRELHSALVSNEAQQIIEIAKYYGAVGWKVNGAGGDGGSLTLLGGADATQQRAMLHAIEQENRKFKIIPIHLAQSAAYVWEIE